MHRSYLVRSYFTSRNSTALFWAIIGRDGVTLCVEIEELVKVLIFKNFWHKVSAGFYFFRSHKTTKERSVTTRETSKNWKCRRP